MHCSLPKHDLQLSLPPKTTRGCSKQKICNGFRLVYPPPPQTKKQGNGYLRHPMASYGLPISDRLGGAPLTSNHLARLTELRGVVPGGSRSVRVPSLFNQQFRSVKKGLPKKEGSHPTIHFQGRTVSFWG